MAAGFSPISRRVWETTSIRGEFPTTWLTSISAPASITSWCLYGVGDHGGGPTRNDAGQRLRWQKDRTSSRRLTFSTAQTFFDGVTKDQYHLKIPVWKNELYFQHHRGVQTTQAETKKRMRRSEDLLINAEKFASLATLDRQAYPQEEFQSDWEKVLFNQFHDILPGLGHCHQLRGRGTRFA